MCDILFPVGRMVGGSLYRANPVTDNDGKPVLDKEGRPKTSYSIGVAIPKNGEPTWQQTVWGQQIKQVADTAYGAQTQHPMFSWKITDGDSQIPNKRNKRPCDQEGYPGHWVLWFSQSWAPRMCNANGTQDLTEPDAIVPGYFVQVFANVAANGSLSKPAQTPGVYLNPVAVALSGYGNRIAPNDVDTAAIGFGNAPLPPGASAMPPAAYVPPQPVAPAAPAAYVPPQAPATPAAYVPPVAPNPAILVPPVVPPPPAHVMTALATAPYDAYIAAGYNDAMLVQMGLMQA